MEVVSVRVPAKLKRALEQRAENEGRSTGALAIELLEQVEPR
jgi:predicted transcriptional regulator